MSRLFNFKASLTKTLLAVAASALILVNTLPVQAAVINDIHTSSSYATDAILALADKDIISGDQNGNFYPHGIITRAEMAKIIVNMMGIDTTVDENETAHFSDVPKTHWAYKYVEAAYREGIVNGLPDGSFGVGMKLERQQMAVMFGRAIGLSDSKVNTQNVYKNLAKFSDEGTIGSWAKGYAGFAVQAGLMNGTSSTEFLPKGNAERQQVALVANRFLEDKDNVEQLAESVEMTNTEKYPELYAALKNSENFKGEFNSTGSILLKDFAPDTDLTIDLSVQGTVYGSDFRADFTAVPKMEGLPDTQLNMGLVKTGDDIYAKLPESNEWIKTSTQEIKELAGVTEISAEGAPALENVFDLLSVEKVGNVDVNGVSAVKYVLTMDGDTLGALVPDEGTGELSGAVPSVKIDVYVNGENQIVKQSVNINVDDEESGSAAVALDISYTHMEDGIEITAPQPISEVTLGDILAGFAASGFNPDEEFAGN